MANPTNPFNWQMPTSTDLVTDLPADFEVFGQAVATSMADLLGGTTGQVLSKASNTDMDFTWVAQDDSNAIQNAIVDAKGDLIAATAADTPARLAVGTNGQVLTADSTAATGLAWATPSTGATSLGFAAGKNKIINGDFRFNQRNFTSGNSGDPYGLDRWRMQSSSGCTYSAQTFTPGTAPVAGYEAINFARMLTTGQSGTSVYSILTQYIEDVRSFANQTTTVSFWAKSASGTPKIAVELEQAFGTGGSPSSPVGVYAGQVTLSTSWTRYSVTVAVPSISGKTIGTNANTSNLGLNLWVSAGTDFNARTGSLGIQSNTFDVWGVQMEAGSTLTAFQTATGTIQGELAACQRYYVRWSGGNSYSHFGTGVTQSATNAYFTVVQPVEMRVAPTALDFSTMGFFNYVPNVFALSNLTLNSATTKVSQLYGTTSGATAQQFVTLCTNNSTAGFIGLSAEL